MSLKNQAVRGLKWTILFSQNGLLKENAKLLHVAPERIDYYNTFSLAEKKKFGLNANDGIIYFCKK